MYSEEQVKAYKGQAQEIKEELRGAGYIDVDIAPIAYFLLQSSIGGAQRFSELEEGTADVMARAAALLKEFEEEN